MIELIAVIFTLISVYLTVKGNILCWPTSIIGVTFYSIVFYQHNLYADFFLQLVFFTQSIIGWIHWKNPKENLKIGWIKGKKVKYFILSISLYIITYITSILLRGHMPILDSLVSTLSIVATFLLIKKKIESWILWIINDIILIILFSMNGLNISSYVYFLFFILASGGLINWIKKYNNEK